MPSFTDPTGSDQPYIRSPSGSSPRDATTRQYDLFVIYAQSDACFVEGYLLPQLGLPADAVLLSTALTPGAPLVGQIERGVSRSALTVAVLSPAYLQERWTVFGEQLAGHIAGVEGRLIPLLLADCEVPLRLDFRVALDFRDPRRWAEEAGRLRGLLGDGPPSRREELSCPYPGMRAFANGDADRFFGRSRMVDELVGRLKAGERELYVIGPSGSGKSSLVSAGILPRLQRTPELLGGPTFVQAMRPGERPVERFSEAIGRSPEAPQRAPDGLTAGHHPSWRFALFVDQLEELFTLADGEQRTRFVAMLRALRRDPRYVLILALRADFYDELLSSELWTDLDGDLPRVDLAPLRGPPLAEAVEAPARQLGVFLEPRLCERLLADAANEPGALPLLQEALVLLWERREQRLLRLSDYEALGEGGERSGLAVALSHRADAVYRALTPAQRGVARRVLLRLVSFGEGRKDTRRQQPREALRSAADVATDFQDTLALLAENRLLTLSREGEQDVVDLSHEALIAAWPLFRDWLRTRRNDEARRRVLESRAREWVERGAGPGGLLDAVELADAERWMRSDAAGELGHTPQFARLVAASRTTLQERELQERRRSRRIIAGLTAVAVALSVLTLAARTEQTKAVRLALLADQRKNEATLQSREARRLLGSIYEGQGRERLLAGRPLEALPYFVAAQQEGLDGPALRTLFARALSPLPLVDAELRVPSQMPRKDPPLVGVLVSPDATRFFTVDDDAARIWDLSTGQPVSAPMLHRAPIRHLSLSADGLRILTASVDGTARVWDAKTGSPLSPALVHQAQVNDAAFSHDGTRIATASLDHTARVWDAVTGAPLSAPLGSGVPLWEVAFSADDARIVAASGDGTARTWNPTTGALVSLCRCAKGIALSDIALSDDGARMVAADPGGIARVWDTASGELVMGPLDNPGSEGLVGFGADGASVMVSVRPWQPDGTPSNELTIRIWSATADHHVASSVFNEMSGSAFDADETAIVQGGFGRILLWNASRRQRLTVRPEYSGLAVSLDTTRVVSVHFFEERVHIWNTRDGMLLPQSAPLALAAFSPDGQRFITASGDRGDPKVPGLARIWSTSTGKPLTETFDAQSGIHGVAFSPDGRRVATGCIDGTARVWDADSGAPTAIRLRHEKAILSVAWSPDGKRLATASEDGTARLWNAQTGEPTAPPLFHQDEVYSIAFAPDGAKVATASGDGTARLWDVATGQPAGPPLPTEGRAVVSMPVVAFSPDGTRIAAGGLTKEGRGFIGVWDAKSAKLQRALDADQAVSVLAFSPDGAELAVGSASGIVWVWSLASGKQIAPPLVHSGGVTGVAFSPDGRRIATSTLGADAGLWDVMTGQPLAPALLHGDSVYSVAFSADGAMVLTASRDGSAGLWNVAPDRHSRDEWSQLARASPLLLVDGIPRERRDALGSISECLRQAASDKH